MKSEHSSTQRTRIDGFRYLAVTLPLLIAGYLPLFAQWEGVYGGPECVDGGEGVTTAVGSSECNLQNGYITVGWTYSTSTDQCRSDTNIWVVRTNLAGTQVWERSIDIGGDDHAYDVKQTADSGFIIVGSTENLPPENETNCFDSSVATDDAFLLKLDACGNVQWVKTYGTGAGREVGFEVIETTVGTAGDFVVAGTYFGTGGPDGLLFRTNSAGALLWDQRYGTATGLEQLHSLTESTAAVGGGLPTGDIIATGRIRNATTANWDLYLIRVNSANGQIGAAPQGALIYGGASQEFGNSVIELQNPANAGNIVVAGFSLATTNPFGFNSVEILLMETGPNICAGPIADMLYGDQSTGSDIAYSVQEIQSVGTAGNLIVTGQVDLSSQMVGLGMTDAFLMEVVPAAVAVPPTPALGIWPAGLGFAVYGGTGDDVGRTVIEDGVNSAYVFAGSEQSNKAGGAPADPEQLYLVRTSAAGSTGCEQTPTPQTVVPGYAWTCSANTLGPVLDTCDPEITVDTLEYDTVVCTPPAPKWSLTELGSIGSAEGETPLYSGMNPLTAGADLILLIPPNASEVTVHDVSARTVYESGTESAPVPGELRIATGGWPAGVYIISVTRSGILMREKVVIQAK